MRRVVLMCLAAMVSMTAFASLPSVAERVLALGRICSEVNETFPDAERYNTANVDSLYLAYIPKVAGAAEEYDYYQSLSSFTAHLSEGHTRIMVPEQAPYSFPRVEFERLDSVIYVSNVSESLSAELPLYSRVLAVDGVDALRYLTDSVSPYISASNERWRLDKAATQLLYGRPGTTAAVTLQTPDGAERELTLARDEADDASPMLLSKPTMEFSWVGDSVLYMALNNCMDVDGAKRAFTEHLLYLYKAKGVIIDVRANRGGSEVAWYLPAFCTIDKDTLSYKGQFVYRTATPISDDATPAFSNGTYECSKEFEPYTNGVPAEYRVELPTVILSGKYTGSAAEFFVQFMRENRPDITVIGEPSVGSMTIPKFVDLPGGYTLMIAEAMYRDENGALIHRSCIIPDIVIYPTLADIRTGQDPALERGIEVIAKQGGRKVD